MMGTYSPETCREKKINTLRKTVHQVGFIYNIFVGVIHVMIELKVNNPDIYSLHQES
jgi:hypothetical protein